LFVSETNIGRIGFGQPTFLLFLSDTSERKFNFSRSYKNSKSKILNRASVWHSIRDKKLPKHLLSIRTAFARNLKNLVFVNRKPFFSDIFSSHFQTIIAIFTIQKHCYTILN
jgi:hypothetical protein